MSPSRPPAGSSSPSSPAPGAARPRSRNQPFSLPLPGSPSSSWAVYRARLRSILSGLLRDAAAADGGPKMLAAFWLFGLINNVLYVVILSAAQDLVGSDVPKAAVLLADVLPSFFVKLLAPYFIHRVPYSLRVCAFAAASSAGMCLIALAGPSPSDAGAGAGAGAVPARMLGVVLASLSSGGGELSFLGLTHFYGHMSLAAWGSGTGAAGIAGAGLYVLLTDWIGIGVRDSLLVSAVLPVIMLVSFFVVLPRGPLGDDGGANKSSRRADYEPVVSRLDEEDPGPDSDSDGDGLDVPTNAASSLLENGGHHQGVGVTPLSGGLGHNLRRARSLFVPYMLPLFLVYMAEYTINQGVSPTLLFPLEQSPFREYRDFYPMYGLLYQVGVFVSRTSVAVLRVRRLYLPSLLQVANLALLTCHALFPFLPSVWVVFAVVLWEGLLGGAVYVNTFADIMESVPPAEREFSLAATSVSDSAGICASGFLGMALEVWLCGWQVRHGRDWCKRIGVSGGA